MAFAMVTYTGQNLGAGKTDRIKEGTRIGVLIGVLTSFVITGLMFLFGRNILGLFISADASQGSQAAVVAWRFFADYEQLLMGTVYFTYRPQRDPGNGKYRDSACIRNF